MKLLFVLVTAPLIFAYRLPASDLGWIPTTLHGLQYPLLAAQAQVQGDVKLRLSLDSQGHVSRAEVISGDSILAEAARQSILSWKFSRPCQPAAGDQTIDFTYRFRLEGVVDSHPRTAFSYEHPFKATVISKALAWQPAKAKNRASTWPLIYPGRHRKSGVAINPVVGPESFVSARRSSAGLILEMKGVVHVTVEGIFGVSAHFQCSKATVEAVAETTEFNRRT